MSLCDHDEFKKGNVHTDFIPMHREKLFEFAKQTNIDEQTVCCALATIINHESNLGKNRATINGDFKSIVDMLPNFQVNSALEKTYRLVFNNEAKSKFIIGVKHSTQANNQYHFTVNQKEHAVEFISLDPATRTYQCEVDGHRIKFSYFLDAESGFYNCFLNDNLYEFQLEEPKYVSEEHGGHAHSSADDANEAIAPMPGVVDKINVKVGDKVKKGDPLVVMIAMKMEYVIRAKRDGSVKSVGAAVGQNVKKTHKLVVLGD